MKRFALLVLSLCVAPCLAAAQIGIYQHGSVVRMHMGDCIFAHHGLMVSLGGPAAPSTQDSCPEYTLVSDRVVYVIVGKSSNQIIPLAETIDFRLRKNELAVRVDDAKHETKFMIKDMIVRTDWERLQKHLDEQLRAAGDQASMKTRD
jgi:hypothetical protein